LIVFASTTVAVRGQGVPPLPAASTGPRPRGGAEPGAKPAASTVEERLQRLEEQNRLLAEQNRRLMEQLEALTGQYRTLNERVGDGRDDTSDEGGAGARDNPAGDDAPGPDDLPSALPDVDEDTSDEGGAGARDNPPERTGARIPIKGYFGPGFEWETEDGEFQIQFHNETQVEYREFDHTGQGTVHDGFFLPRQIWYFTGRITKPIEYYTAFQKGFGNVNVRDAFLNFRYDERFMVKAGRYKPPFTYEFYAISNQDLMSPERSLFSINFGDNRELGLMAWGQLFDKRLDYAAGVFNGPRNSFEDTNDAKNVVAYLNARPFGNSERFAFLNHLNLGGSVDAGRQQDPEPPLALRTAVNASDSSGSSTAAPAFLVFNRNVVENGPRALWNLHLAYFFNGLSLQAEWNSGYASYAPTSDLGQRTRVPIQGYYLQAGYFLTGETLSRRTQVDILRPFSLKPGEFGLGAFEVQSRFSALGLGREVFDGGLADPNLWSNRVYAIDAGLNWYLNRYVKVYFDWQHSEFGDPVIFERGQFRRTSNLYWIRLQIYF
jgi:phosphate-selective porin OprO/OprP